MAVSNEYGWVVDPQIPVADEIIVAALETHLSHVSALVNLVYEYLNSAQTVEVTKMFYYDKPSFLPLWSTINLHTVKIVGCYAPQFNLLAQVLRLLRQCPRLKELELSHPNPDPFLKQIAFAIDLDRFRMDADTYHTYECYILARRVNNLSMEAHVLQSAIKETATVKRTLSEENKKKLAEHQWFKFDKAEQNFYAVIDKHSRYPEDKSEAIGMAIQYFEYGIFETLKKIPGLKIVSIIGGTSLLYAKIAEHNLFPQITIDMSISDIWDCKTVNPISTRLPKKSKHS